MTPKEFWDILHSAPESQPVFWRLYYNDQGEPVCYSMEDLLGNYVDIDAETFALGPHNVRVVDSKLKYITMQTAEKLMPSSSGTACHPQDISVIVSADSPHELWKKEIND